MKEVKYQVKPSKIKVKKLSSTEVHIYRETMEGFRVGTSRRYYE
jgi:hypothetical protein